MGAGDSFWDSWQGRAGGGGRTTTRSGPRGRARQAETRRDEARRPRNIEKSLIRLTSRFAGLVEEGRRTGEAFEWGKPKGDPVTTDRYTRDYDRALAAIRDATKGYKPKALRKALNRAGIEGPARQIIEDTHRAANTSSWAETGLDYLGRPAEAVKGALVEGTGNPFSGKTWEGAWRGLSGKERYSGIQALARGGSGGLVSKREAAEFEEGLPGPVRFVGNLATDIGLDPTSYLSFGATSAAKGAARSVAPDLARLRGVDEVADVAESLRKTGWRGLSKSEKAFVLSEFGKGTQRLLRGAPGGVKVAGRSIPGTGPALGKVGKALGRKTPATAAERVLRAPRTGLRQLERSGAGDDLAGQVERLGAETLGAVPGRELAAKQTMNWMAKNVPDEGDRLALSEALDAVDSPAAIESLPKHLRSTGRRLRQMLDESYETDVAHGLLRPREQVADEALERVGEGAALGPEAIPDIPGVTRGYFPFTRPEPGSPKVVAPANPLGSSMPRRYGRSEDLRDLSLRERVEAGIPTETDPFLATGKRATQSIREAGRLDYVEGLSKIQLEDGSTLLRPATGVAEPGWVDVDVPLAARDEAGDIIEGAPRLQPMQVREEVASEFQRAMRVLTDETDFGRFAKTLDKYMSLWKGYATVPFPFGAGFVIRNATGNVWNSVVLAGTNPRYFFKAKSLQKKMARGLDDVGDPLALLSDSERVIVSEALDNNALSTGFFRSDVGAFDPDTVGTATWKQKINPLSEQFKPIEVGRRFNDWIEQNARLGTYLGQRAKGLAPAEAAQQVRKYLFDYGDLTDLDRRIKLFSPFWTFTRKNTPLQLEHMVKTPGRFTALDHFIDALRGESAEHEEQYVPEWITKSGGAVLPFEIGDKPVAYVPDLPPFAAQEALAPALSLLPFLTGEPGGGRQFARDLFNTLGIGGPAGIVKALGEVAAGRQIFSQREFKPGEEVELPPYLQPFEPLLGDTIPYESQFLLEQLAPGATKVRGILPTEEQDEDAQTRRILSMLTGQQFWPIGDATARSELYRRLDEAGLNQAALAREGLVLPEGKYRRKKASPSGGGDADEFWDAWTGG